MMFFAEYISIFFFQKKKYVICVFREMHVFDTIYNLLNNDSIKTAVIY